MRKVAFLLLMLLFVMVPACVTAGPVTAEWDLSVDDAYLGATGGYRLYTGTVSGSLAAVGTVGPGKTALTVSLPPGAYFGAMTSFAGGGLESPRTPEVAFTVLPGMPTNLRFRIP
jgi:hypothetical protein